MMALLCLIGKSLEKHKACMTLCMIGRDSLHCTCICCDFTVIALLWARLVTIQFTYMYFVVNKVIQWHN